jgi:hypothetical protein
MYQGHIHTFHHICECRPAAFHLMMSNIYTQARRVLLDLPLSSPLIYHCIFSAADATAAIPIADFDLEEMEG